MAKKDEEKSMDSVRKEFSDVRLEGDEENAKSEHSQRKTTDTTYPLGNRKSPFNMKEGNVEEGGEDEETDPATFDPAVEEKLNETIKNMELWVDDEFNRQLKGLEFGRVEMGHSFVYRLWKSALNNWFKKNMSVVIVSPFIDAARLQDIMTLKMANKGGKIHSIYIRDEGKLQAMKRMSRNHYPKSENLDIFLEEKIYNKIRCIIASGDPTKYFHCKFIAALKDGNASVLSGSANFQASHFDRMKDGRENLENIAFFTMLENTFQANYLQPLLDLENRGNPFDD